MKTIQLPLYRFSELSNTAKDYVLKENLDINTSYGWWEFIYDDFIAICKTLAIAVEEDQIFFRGFYSQGDGSSFKAKADLLQLMEAIATQAWTAYASNLQFQFPEVPTNNRIYQLLKTGRITTRPRIEPSSRHYHIAAQLHWHFEEHQCTNYDRIDEAMMALDNWFESVAKALNEFLYRSLETAFEYETSDDAIIQSIEANNNWFTADGRSANRLNQLQSYPLTDKE